MQTGLGIGLRRLMWLVWALMLLPQAASAREYRVQMLNFGEQGSMVFEPAFLQVQPGDTVHFVATNSGHSVKSYQVPEGAENWASADGEDYSVTLQQQGVYVYYSPPHLMMAMVGVIQVGEASNYARVEAELPRLRSKLVMEGKRLDQLWQQVEPPK